MAITTIDEPWGNNHTHEEVENFIKSEIRRLNNETDNGRITITINDGRYNRFFISDSIESENLSFNYTITYTSGENQMPNVSYRMMWRNKDNNSDEWTTVESGMATTNNQRISYNFSEVFKSNNVKSIEVGIEAFDLQIGTDQYGQQAYIEKFKQITSVNFTKQIGSIKATTPLGDVNSPYIKYYVTLGPNTSGVIRGDVYDKTNTYILSACSIERSIANNTGLTSSDEYLIPRPSFDSNEGGPHIIKAYLELNNSDNVEKARTDIVTSTIISEYGVGDNETYILSDDITSAYENNYIDIEFMVYTPGQNEIPIVLQEKQGNTWATMATRRMVNENIQTWSYFVNRSAANIDGYIQLRIGRPSVAPDETINYQSIIASKIISFYVLESGITWDKASLNNGDGDFYLTAQNKTNYDHDIGNWSYGNSYKMIFENFQWNNNGSGWKDIYLNNNGKVVESSSQGVNSTALHLVGTSKAYIRNFYPFYDEQEGGILKYGRTIKISFMVSDISNPDEKVIECYDGNIGFYVTGDSIYINIGKELIDRPDKNPKGRYVNFRKFSPDTKIDLTIVVQPLVKNGRNTKHEIRYYINGEIAGFNVLDDGVTSLSQTSSSKTLLKFGGTGATLNLFNIRYHRRDLTSFEVLKTRTMDLDNSIEMNNVYYKNKYYSLENNSPVISIDSAIEYGKYLASKGKKNFGVWISTTLCNADDNPNFPGKTSAQSTKPESFYLYRFTTDSNGNGIIDPNLTFFIEATGISGTESYLNMRRQGTSTKDSTKGNIRIDVKNTCIYHRYNPVSGEFYAYEPEQGKTIDTDPVYTEHISEITRNSFLVGKKAKVWQIPDDKAIPCYLLTCKKNPNESTQARNLPTAKWYEDCCRYLATIQVNGQYIYEDCLTMPQRKELQSIITNRPELDTREKQVSAIKTRQCVDGFPSIGFKIKYSDNQASINTQDNKLNPISLSSNITFGGQFDMITDKTNMEVFGFGGYHTQDANGNLEWHKNSSGSTDTENTNPAFPPVIGDEDFSIEWRRNNSPICNFLTQDLHALNGQTSFVGVGGLGIMPENPFQLDLEYRYPDEEFVISESSHVTKEIEVDGNTVSVSAHTIGMGYTDPMQRLFDFVRTCAVHEKETQNGKEFFIDGVPGEYYLDGKKRDSDASKLILRNYDGSQRGVPIDDTPTNRLNKFHDELGYYVVLNQFLFNAIAIDAGLMVDQDVKNQFFTCFTGEYYANNPSNKGLLRLLGYDFDSSWDMDNDNCFRFPYTVKYDDGLYDGSSIINENEPDGLLYSEDALKNVNRSPVLWQMFYWVFSNEIATMASYLYDSFLNKNAILKRMEDDQIDVYNSLIYNANSEYSYTEKSADYSKSHGAAKEHTEWFVDGRMYYYSARNSMTSTSNNPKGDFGNGALAHFKLISMTRTADNELNFENHGSENWKITVTGYERTAASLRYGSNNCSAIKDVDVIKTYDNDGILLNIERPTTELTISGVPSGGSLLGNADMFIYGCKHLKTITGLSRWYISSIDNWGDLINIEELEIGSTAILEKDIYNEFNEKIGEKEELYENPLLSSFIIDKPLGSCKKLNLAGCTNITSLDLTKAPILEEFEGSHMERVTSIIFPSGDSLRVAHLSTGLISLNIVNKPNLREITFNDANDSVGEMPPITSITVENSSDYIAQYVIQNLL